MHASSPPVDPFERQNPIRAPQGSPLDSARQVSADFRLLVEGALDVTTLLDGQGRILYISPSVQAVLGYGPHELVGRNAFELVHGDDYPLAVDLLLRAVSGSGPGSLLTLRFRHRTDGWRMLESSGGVVGPGEPSPRLVVVSRDVTGRRQRGRARPAGRRQLRDLHIEMLERLTRAAEFRDDQTGQHTRRVGDLAAALAGAAGLPASAVETLRRAAPLHDVGKIGIRDSILLKPGPLDAEELAVMRTHTILGARILSQGSSALMRTAETVALCHHEQWDGGGYPRGLRGESIPLAARIVALADFFDALTHDRPYRRAWERSEVLRRIREEAGHRFDPDLVERFLAIDPSSGPPFLPCPAG